MALNYTTFAVNPNNGFVGIGTATPTAALEVQNASTATNLMACTKKFIGSYPPAAKTFSTTGSNSSSVQSNVSITITPYYPPDYLTTVSNVFSGNLYGDGTYLSSSSTTSGATYNAWKAFDSSDASGWRPSGTTTYRNTCNVSFPAFYTSTVTTSNTSGSNFWGEWLQLTFPSATVIQSTAITAAAPVPWTYFIVANNGADNTAWTTLYSMSNNNNVYNTLSNNTTAYSKYRLVVTNLSNVAASSTTTLEVRDWKLYGSNITVGPSTRTYTNYTPSSYSTSATLTTSDAQYNTGTYTVTMSNWTHLNVNATTVDTNAVPMVYSDSSTYTVAAPQGLLNTAAATTFTTASNAFTSNADTSPLAYVYLQFPSISNLPISKYSITGSTTTAQSPSKWTLESSANGTSWAQIDSQSGITSWTASETKTYTLTSETTYSNYRFGFSRNCSATGAPLSIARILMFGSGPSTVPMMNFTVNAQSAAYTDHVSLSNQQIGVMKICGGLAVGYANTSVTPSQGELHVEGDIRSPVLTGAIMYFATSNAPTGWVKCNGATVSRTTYDKLFNVIGTIHGAGDGSTTFTLPDLRGEFVRGWDDSRSVDASRVFGSAQTGTSINTVATNTYVVGIQDFELVSPYDVTRNMVNTTNTGTQTGQWRTVRPRNVALLACIKY